ncbi:MAG: hypothetical protein Q8Q03_01155, partial [bacterium]|nr:hypothetical protein [bacterium]
MDNQNTQNVPADILEAIDSSNVYAKLETIADRYSLHIDQLGQLNADTEGVMVGKIKSDKFVDTIAKSLEIPEKTAEKIAIDINNEIFASIRESLRITQEEAENPPQPASTTAKSIPLSSPPPPSPNPLNLGSVDKLEKAGNFTIEKIQPSNSPQYNDSLLTKEGVLKEVEEAGKKTGVGEGVSFVDHLLSNPVSV